MNYKLEKFWNDDEKIIVDLLEKMNYKLEKFWNSHSYFNPAWYLFMNYKLEKFWNEKLVKLIPSVCLWTINLKSFEMFFPKLYQ